LEELRRLFTDLQQAEECSSQELDSLSLKSQKEVRILRSLIEEKTLIIEVLQKDLECAKEERRIASS